MFETVCLVGFIFAICWIIGTIREAIDNRREAKYFSQSRGDYSQPSSHHQETLPNGYTRQDYYDHGYSDTDIECWGLDQQAAPNPEAAGFVIADMMDGDIDGHIGPPFM